MNPWHVPIHYEKVRGVGGAKGVRVGISQVGISPLSGGVKSEGVIVLV